MKKRIAVLGATSAIAIAYLRRTAAQGHHLILVGRNSEKIQEITDDLKAHGASSITSHLLDVESFDQHEDVINSIFEKDVDTLLVSFGTLPDQALCFKDHNYALKHIQINAVATVSLCILIAQKLKSIKKGNLAVITSVAGDRGKKSNYVYGASKSFVSTFLAGLRNDLYKSGVHVVDLKLGFVDTPMTQDFDKGPLWSSSEKVAQGIESAIEKKKNIAYIPFFWRWIMLVIRSIPENLFKKMKL